MRRFDFQRLCLIFLLLFCLILNSCKIPENVLQSTSEVDFSVPVKIQISFNEHIYDTIVVLKNSNFEINFTNEKDLLDGAYICFSENKYRITYKDMVFKGELSELNNSFLPSLVYKFIISFEGKLLLDDYDDLRECYYKKENINGYFILFECYEREEEKFYSIEIK